MVTPFAVVRHRKTHREHGFTLIELLIVIAIILILIAIALPNFLEAQERARVTRGRGHLRSMETALFSHMTQFGYLYADYNDPTPVLRLTRNKNMGSFAHPCPTTPPPITSKGGLDFLGDGIAIGSTQMNFYAPALHCPLTTPIKYIEASTTVDPWSDGTISVGMDSRYIQPGSAGNDPKGIIYAAFFVAGPDRMAGHWSRGVCDNFNGDHCCNGLPYNPTNGTKSDGELWLVMGDWAYLAPWAAASESDCATGKREYGGLQKS